MKNNFSDFTRPAERKRESFDAFRNNDARLKPDKGSKEGSKAGPKEARKKGRKES